MTDRAMLWVVLYGIIPFWFLNGDPTYSLDSLYSMKHSQIPSKSAVFLAEEG